MLTLKTKGIFMASGHCNACRFFDGSNCAVSGSRMSSGSSCGNFVDNTGGSSDKHCKNCRFFDGQNCKSSNSRMSSGSSCGKFAAFR